MYIEILEMCLKIISPLLKKKLYHNIYWYWIIVQPYSNDFFPAECRQLMNSQGSTLSDQIIAINQSGQSEQESEGQIQSLLGQSIADPGTVQTNLTTSQNMEKIDDLLVSLQEQGNNISHSY